MAEANATVTHTVRALDLILPPYTGGLRLYNSKNSRGGCIPQTPQLTPDLGKVAVHAVTRNIQSIPFSHGQHGPECPSQKRTAAQSELNVPPPPPRHIFKIS